MPEKIVITKEFIKELEKARDLFEWTLSQATGPVAERRATPRFRIRARLKNSSDMVQFDPIGAVCFARTGMTFSEDYWVEAAISIGLPVEDARDLTAAGNDLTWRTIDDKREPDPYKQALRKMLVDATGLQTASVASVPDFA
jgi:hypothetical protein